MQVLSNLADLRKLNNLTQAQLAEQANLAQPTLAKIERGALTSTGTAQALADLLGVSLDVVLWTAKTTTSDLDS